MVLVTGGTGLVGSHLLLKLAQQNQSVRAIYRKGADLNRVKTVFSYYSINSKSLYDTIEWTEADLNDLPKLTMAFRDITHVFHCAAYISFDPANYKILRATNIKGTANIVNLCIANKVEKLCHVSSVATLGYNADLITCWELPRVNSCNIFNYRPRKSCKSLYGIRADIVCFGKVIGGGLP